MVLLRERPPNPEDLIAPMLSVPVSVGWRWPKAELERRTGNPYAPFGRGGLSG